MDNADTTPPMCSSSQDSTHGNKDIEKLKSKTIQKWRGLRGDVFECCPWEKFTRPGPQDLWTWKTSTPNESKIPGVTDKTQALSKLEEVLPILWDGGRKIRNPPKDKIQVTWIGHATVYVQFDGISILTDPVFKDMCGPVMIESFSYKRYRKAPCMISDLPGIDAVIISHNHYDHLEESAVKEINKFFPDAKWFVTLKQNEFLIDKKVKEPQIIQLDWWDEKKAIIDEKSFRFVCVPSQHWCQRGPLDMNKVLWCSWVVKGPTKSFYFAGDTGYHDKLFQTIGQKYGPFDLAAIPIGAYNPRFITKFQHVDPEEAVKIHKDVRSKQSIGIHWGTFELTNEFYAEPPQKVEDEMIKEQLIPKDFSSLCHGETWIVGDPRKRPPFMDVKPPAQENRSERRQDHTQSSW